MARIDGEIAVLGIVGFVVALVGVFLTFGWRVGILVTGVAMFAAAWRMSSNPPKIY